MLENHDNGFRACEFVRVIDGDTFVGRVITLNVRAERHSVEIHIRVYGWNAAELKTTEGPILRGMFEALLQKAKSISVQAVGRSFERIVCRVFIDDLPFQGLLIETLRTLRGEHP